MVSEKSAASSTECVCPRCNKIHRKLLMWIGNGTPRKFCAKCEQIDNPIEEFGINNEAAYEAVDLTFEPI